MLPPPFIHGYLLSPLEDISEVIAMGWFWASGGMVSTPRDLNTFIRAEATGATTNQATRAAQFQFVEGRGVTSVPPGPGRNSAGPAIFRYETACGTVYGHTGSFGGWTQFVATTADGSRSTTVSLNASIVPHPTGGPSSCFSRSSCGRCARRWRSGRDQISRRARGVIVVAG